MKKIILLIGLILFSLIVYSTAFNGSEVEFKEFYSYTKENLSPVEKIKKEVFFKDEELWVYIELNKKSANMVAGYFDAEKRSDFSSLPETTINSPYNLNLTGLEPGNYTFRAEVYESKDAKTIREMNFTVLETSKTIEVPETNPMLIIGLLIGIIAIIHRN
ncbi:MAG: hypothetical protein JW703_01350 [Candidatus Diapherotrites archaeon]|nr:hypothetical protein [Candidatus Diapherotrites archaeon]